VITIEIDEFGGSLGILGPIIIYQNGHQIADLEGYYDDKIAINVGGVTRYLATIIEDGSVIRHSFGRGFEGELFDENDSITEDRV